jgi:hypothetical protein
MADKDRAYSYSSYLPQRLLNIFQGRKPTPGLPQPEITESRPLEDTLTDLQILSQLEDAHNHEYRPVPNAPRVQRTETIRHNSIPDLSQRQPVRLESSGQQNIDNRSEDLVGGRSRSSTLQVPGSSNLERARGSEVSQTEEDFDDEGRESGSFQDDSAYGDTISKATGYSGLVTTRDRRRKNSSSVSSICNSGKRPSEPGWVATPGKQPKSRT